MGIELEPLIAFAETLADAAGAAIRPHFRTAFPVDIKADLSPVTLADREAESVMRRRIEAAYPEHGIIGEEFGRRDETAELVWVLDPIDGTRSFISGVPMFGILIALLHRGRPVLGIIDQPVSGERWLGAAGRPTLFQGRSARTRACPELGRAILFTTAPELLRGSDAAAFRRVQAKVSLTRYSSDCYAYGLLAAGHVDLVVEAGLQVHDFAALIPVIEGAGGRITDWRGNPLGPGSDGRVLAAGDAALHAAAIGLLGEGTA